MNWIFVTLCFIAGILAESTFGALSAVLFFVSFVVVSAVKLIFGVKIKPVMLMGIAAFCVAVCFTDSAKVNPLDDYAMHYAWIDGTVVSVPKQSGENYHYTVAVDFVTVGDKTENIHTNMLLSTKQYLAVNEPVAVNGSIEYFKGSQNEYGFDAEKYYKSMNINYTMYSDKIYKSKLSHKKYSPQIFSAIFKEKLSNMIYSISSGENANIINAVITGNTSYISDELKDAMTKGGAYRYLYFCYFFVLIFTFLISLFNERISKNSRVYLTVLLIATVAIFNADRPAFVKTAVYLSVILIIERKIGYVYKIDVLCWTVIAMLWANPLLVYNSSFVISALSTALMLLFGDWVRSKLFFISNKTLKNLIVIVIIYTVGLLPVIAYYYNGISLYSVFLMPIYVTANVVIWVLFLPVYVLVRIFGAAPILSEILTTALSAYSKLPYLTERLPFAYIHLATPGLLMLVFYGVVVAMLYRKIRNKNTRLYLIMAAASLMIIFVTEFQGITNVEFTFVNVGQGDGAIISVPHRDNIIIDGGGRAGYSEYDSGAEMFVPYLISHGKTHIDAAFVSHYHSDHALGVIDALWELDVDELYLPDLMPDCELRKELEDTANETGTEVYYIDEDTTIRFDSGIEFEITVPSDSVLSSDDENDTSIMINAVYGDINCLFTGDMTKTSENDLLGKNAVPEAEIMKVAHHGSATSTSKKWVDAVNPDIAVISLGENNMYNFPRQSVIDALGDIDTYRTDKHGDITITANKKKIKSVETYK